MIRVVLVGAAAGGDESGVLVAVVGAGRLGRQVVAHADRCPESEMWRVEYTDDCDGMSKPESIGPMPPEVSYVRAIGLRSRWWASDVRLVRVRKESIHA